MAAKICTQCSSTFKIQYTDKTDITSFGSYKRLKCFVCLPYKSNTQKLLDRKNKVPRKCTNCKLILPYNNFFIRKSGSPYSVCKKCVSDHNKPILKEKERIKKQKVVNYKGGKCKLCGYFKYLAALEFHHLDPSIKEHQISYIKKRTSEEIIIKELDKCILVCANCHREQHYNTENSGYFADYVNEEFLREIW